jgi:hypothetical protein
LGAPPASPGAPSDGPRAVVRVEVGADLFVDPPHLLDRAEVLPVALAALRGDEDVTGSGDQELAIVVGDLDLALDDVGDLVVRALEVPALRVATPQAEAELVVDGACRGELLPGRLCLVRAVHGLVPHHVLGPDDADLGGAFLAHGSSWRGPLPIV